jgi:hypothetical protein
MHFLFGLLRIKGLYMFRALLAHPQEALHKKHLVLRACYVSWLHQDWSGTGFCISAEPRHRLRVFENRLLGKRFVPERVEVTGEWRRLHKEELYDLPSPNIIQVIKPRIMRWAGSVARMGDRRGAYRV